MNYLKAQLGFKGERGYSAYEIAVQNGFEGTEQDWLATLGTSSHLTQDTVSYTSIEGQTEFNLPANYTSDTFVDVYVDGARIVSDEYIISNNKVVFASGLESNKTVEIVEMNMSTNSLPIVTTIDSESTDDMVPSAKTTYGIKQATENNAASISELVTNLDSLSNTVTNLGDSVSVNTSSIGTLNTTLTEVSGKVENVTEYSITEKAIGKWIDGSFLYRKTIDIGSLPNASEKATAHGISNIDIITKIDGVIYNSEGRTFPLPALSFGLGSGDVRPSTYVFADKTNITVGAGTDRSAYRGYVTMEYTKTTNVVESN